MAAQVAGPQPTVRPPAPHLYHGTALDNLQEILREGMSAPSFWGTKRMAMHWAWQRYGGQARDLILIKRPLATFDQNHLFWDENMADEPVWFDYVIEADREAAVAKAQGFWEESLEILESAIYDLGVLVGAADVTHLKRQEPHFEAFEV